MKMIRSGILSLLGILLMAGSLQAQDAGKNIKEMLEERDQEIKELVGPEGSTYSDEQRAKLKEIINGVIDFRAMAQEALAETYDTISQEKRDEFVDLFSTIVRDQSLNSLDIYRAEISYKDITVENEKARVETLAQLKNVRTPVNYEMKLDEGQWVITDMEIDDVSTASSYNRQFQRIINKKGFDSLMTSLRKRASRAK